MTTVAERETKRADQLKKGDWLAPGTATEDAPAEVLAVLPYVTDEDGPSVSVIIRDEDGKPATWELTESTKLGLATKAEVDEHRDDARRMQLAAQLRQLAELVVSKRLPLPGRYEHSLVSFNFGRHIDQVDRVAEILGVEREVVYGSGQVKWPSSREGLLDVTWQAYAPNEEPKPEPEPVADPTGLAYTRADDGADPQPAAGRVPAHLEDGVTGEVELIEVESGERVEVGADGCGCPITEELRPNDTSIDGTERVEHRPGCWNA